MTEEDADTEEEHSLTVVAERVPHAGDGDEILVEEILEAFGARSYGPQIFVPALISVSPLGAVPGASIVAGSLIIVVSIQLLIGRDRPWVPSALSGRSVSRDRVKSAVEKMKPWLRRVDRVLHPRWRFLTEPPVRQLLGLLCIGLGASMFPLAVVPMGVFAPGLAATFIAAALVTRDGLLVLGAGLLAVGVVVLVNRAL